jgi:hypothetical protein
MPPSKVTRNLIKHFNETNNVDNLPKFNVINKEVAKMKKLESRDVDVILQSLQPLMKDENDIKMSS